MIDLQQEREDKLRRLSRAGANGLPIAEIGLGTACHFALHDLCTPITFETRTVFITKKGRAYAVREQFA